jgi:hypothetical protein
MAYSPPVLSDELLKAVAGVFFSCFLLVPEGPDIVLTNLRFVIQDVKLIFP